jgi:hypothetical protein
MFTGMVIMAAEDVEHLPSSSKRKEGSTFMSPSDSADGAYSSSVTIISASNEVQDLSYDSVIRSALPVP